MELSVSDLLRCGIIKAPLYLHLKVDINGLTSTIFLFIPCHTFFLDSSTTIQIYNLLYLTYVLYFFFICLYELKFSKLLTTNGEKQQQLY